MTNISFVDAFVVKLDDGMYYFVEEKITGKYIKFTGNDGCQNEVSVAHFNALSHFSYVFGDEEEILVDFQGNIKNLTDPAIHRKENTYQFGSDLGEAGIKKFMDEHKCGLECVVLGLIDLEDFNEAEKLED